MKKNKNRNIRRRLKNSLFIKSNTIISNNSNRGKLNNLLTRKSKDNGKRNRRFGNRKKKQGLNLCKKFMPKDMKILKKKRKGKGKIKRNSKNLKRKWSKNYRNFKNRKQLSF